MFFARLAYFKVLIVSSYYELPGLTVVIITVLQLPPRESLSIRVSLLSLNGTKKPFLFLSPRALMQLARARRLVLIFAPSRSLMPLFSVTVPRSEPAKSIKLSFPCSYSSSVFFMRSLESSMIWHMAWERDDSALAIVASVVRLLLPMVSKFITSLGSLTTNSVTPAITVPMTGSSLRSKY